MHVGLVRRYKGIDALLRAFSALAGEDLSLRIVGSTIDEDVAAEIRSAVAADGRISTLDAYLSDDALVREITASELVVLPFAGVTNSGSLLLALSLDRPVLVRSQPLTEQLAAEAGPGWVLTFTGSLEADVIRQALDTVRDPRSPEAPDLSARDWDAIGAAHAVAFETAVAERSDGCAAAGASRLRQTKERVRWICTSISMQSGSTGGRSSPPRCWLPRSRPTA